MYAVVVFNCTTGPDLVEVVPKSWLKDDSSCWWPPLKGTALSAAIERRLAPNMTSWTVCDRVTVKKETDKYEKARKIARKVENLLSDLDTTDMESARKRRPPTRYLNGGSEEEEETVPRKKVATSSKLRKDFIQEPPVPAFPAIENEAGNHGKDDSTEEGLMATSTPKRNSSGNLYDGILSLDAHLDNFDLNFVANDGTGDGNFDALLSSSHTVVSSDVLTEVEKTMSAKTPSHTVVSSDVLTEVEKTMSAKTPSDTVVSNDTDFEMEKSTTTGTARNEVMPHNSMQRDEAMFKLLQRLVLMSQQQNIMLKKILQQRGSNVQEEDISVDIENFNFPMTTEVDVENVEALLVDEPNRKLLVRHFASLGGLSKRDAVERMCSSIMSNQLASRYNWTGKSPKLGFGGLKLVKSMNVAARKLEMTEAEVQKEVRRWLRGAGDRDGGRKARSLKAKAKDVNPRQEESDNDSDI